jgi:hypothetical protein
MPVLYSDHEVTVKQPLIGGWKIIDEVSGAVFSPNAEIKHKMAQTWFKLRRMKKQVGQLQGDAGEATLFKAFANATMRPQLDGQSFLLLSPESYARALLGLE